MPSTTRTYSKRRRAESEAATRKRITEVTVELHGTVGPANTTVSEIARRAGVQRLTVYSHFPDQRSLFEACTTYWFGLHPPPDPETWRMAPQLRDCVQEALQRVYDYYAENEAMIANWLRDAQLIPVLAEFAASGYYGYVDYLVQTTVPDNGPEAAAVFRVALHFETWRTLTRRREMSNSDAAKIMSASVAAVAT